MSGARIETLISDTRWRRIALVLVVVPGVHLLLLCSWGAIAPLPARNMLAPAAATTATAPSAPVTTVISDEDRCPSRLPLSMGSCADVTAMLPGFTPVPMLLVLLAALGAMRLVLAQSGRGDPWHLPSGRRRAMLQVFRC